jgi:autotransporter adhesin
MKTIETLSISVVLSFLLTTTVQAGTLDNANQADGNNVAIGLEAKALLTNSTAIGANSFATGKSSTAYGAISSATAVNTTAIGTAALAEGEQSTALGAVAQALENNSTAVGGNAMVEAVDGVALGESSTVLEKGGVALGADAFVAAQGSVALGSQSVAEEENTVSVGNADTGLTRRITNVAPAIADHDALNFGQFKQGLSSVRDDAFAGIAAAAAITPAAPSAAGKTAIGLGAATYRGEHALALSFSHRLLNSQRNTQINGGIAYDSSHHTLGKVGVSWEF